jgi:hypothetical protein
MGVSYFIIYKMKYKYYIHWSNFEIDGPFDSFIEAIKKTINDWFFDKQGWEKFPPEEFRGETKQVIKDEEVLYSYNELGVAGFDITRKKYEK